MADVDGDDARVTVALQRGAEQRVVVLDRADARELVFGGPRPGPGRGELLLTR